MPSSLANLFWTVKIYFYPSKIIYRHSLICCACFLKIRKEYFEQRSLCCSHCFSWRCRRLLYTYERIRQWPVTDIMAKGLVQWPLNIRDWRLVQWLKSRNPDFQIFNNSYGYGTSATVRDVSQCTRLKYFTTVTVTGHQSLYEISFTVRDFEHYIRDWSLSIRLVLLPVHFSK